MTTDVQAKPPLTIEERFNVVVNHAFGGWHHVGERKPCGSGVKFCHYGDTSTFDWNVLTRLVLAAHAVRVRVELGNGGPRQLRVLLHPRENSPESWSQHHPSLDDLIAAAEKLKTEISQ